MILWILYDPRAQTTTIDQTPHDLNSIADMLYNTDQHTSHQHGIGWIVIFVQRRRKEKDKEDKNGGNHDQTLL